MIDIIILLMYLTVAAALGVTLWSVYRTAKIIGKTSGKVHGINVRRINIAVCIAIALTMLLSFAFASTSAMKINATSYSDTFWLRMANMFVFTSLLAFAAAVIATIYNFVKIKR